MSDQAVREWYSKPENLGLTDPKAKEFDWLFFPHYTVPVLEIGAGSDSVEWLGWRPWVTLDFVAPPLSLSLGQGVVGDARSLPLKDESFGLVLDLSTGDHIEHGRDRMRREVWRVLRPWGHYIVTYPDSDHYTPVPGAFGYSRGFTRGEMEVELLLAGFVVHAYNRWGSRAGMRAVKHA